MKTMDFRACVAAAVLLFAAAAQAADKYYIGTGGDLKASTAANWLDGTVPVDGDKPNDYANVKLVLKRGAALALTSNLKVGDLVVEEEDATFNLNDFRLKVGSALHRDGIGWRGVTGKEEAAAYLDSIVNPGENSLGRILWPSRGFSIIVR